MRQLKRRDAIKGMVVGTTGLSLTGLAVSRAADDQQSSETTSAARAFRGQHQPKPLPFDPAKLKGLSRSCSDPIMRTTTAAQ